MTNKLFQKILLLAIFGILLAAPAAMAAGILPSESGTPATACTSPNGCGNYTLNDMMQIFINISNWVLGVVGSVALLFFVYGGFVFIFSGGREKEVQKGKDILIGSIIGLFIVFGSFILIKFSTQLLGAKTDTDGLQIQVK